MDFDYDTMGLGQWEDPSSSFQPVAFDNDGIPLLGDYEFGPSSLSCPFTTHGLRYRNREKQPILGRNVREDTPRACQVPAERERLVVRGRPDVGGGDPEGGVG